MPKENSWPTTIKFFLIQVELCQNISRSRNPSRDQLDDSTHQRDGGGGDGGGGGGGGDIDQDSTKHSMMPAGDSSPLHSYVLSHFALEHQYENYFFFTTPFDILCALRKKWNNVW